MAAAPIRCFDCGADRVIMSLANMHQGFRVLGSQYRRHLKALDDLSTRYSADHPVALCPKCMSFSVYL